MINNCSQIQKSRNRRVTGKIGLVSCPSCCLGRLLTVLTLATRLLIIVPDFHTTHVLVLELSPFFIFMYGVGVSVKIPVRFSDARSKVYFYRH